MKLMTFALFFLFALTCVLALDSRFADSIDQSKRATSRRRPTATAVRIPTPSIRDPIVVKNPNQFYFIFCIVLLVVIGLQLLYFLVACFLRYRDRKRYGRVDEEGPAEDKGEDTRNGADEEGENDGDESDGNESDGGNEDAYSRHSWSERE